MLHPSSHKTLKRSQNHWVRNIHSAFIHVMWSLSGTQMHSQFGLWVVSLSIEIKVLTNPSGAAQVCYIKSQRSRTDHRSPWRWLFLKKKSTTQFINNAKLWCCDWDVNRWWVMAPTQRAFSTQENLTVLRVREFICFRSARVHTRWSLDLTESND